MINLGQDEKIIYTAKKHPWSIFLSFTATIASMLILLPWFVYDLLRFKLDRIIVTNKKVYIKTGVLFKSVVTTPIEKINNIHIIKGPIGTILGYGTIVIQSGATLGASGYSYIASPEELQQVIENVAA
jgi:membrane protein YdbS with pleckstrin-like domain